MRRVPSVSKVRFLPSSQPTPVVSSSVLTCDMRNSKTIVHIYVFFVSTTPFCNFFPLAQTITGYSIAASCLQFLNHKNIYAAIILGTTKTLEKRRNACCVICCRLDRGPPKQKVEVGSVSSFLHSIHYVISHPPLVCLLRHTFVSGEHVHHKVVSKYSPPLVLPRRPPLGRRTVRGFL